MLEALASHLAAYPADESGFVFTADRGGPVDRNSLNRVLIRAAAAAGLPKVGFHDLRHHYASVLIDASESVKVVQERLGHASATVTLNTYSHLFPSSEDRTRAAVDAAWRDALVSRSCHAADASG